jgi:hypothetical protein
MFKFRRLRCSFCRKNDTEVLKLVAGPGVFICDKCVAIASRMMSDDCRDDVLTPVPGQTFWQALATRFRRWFTSGDVRRVSLS